MWHTYTDRPRARVLVGFQWSVTSRIVRWGLLCTAPHTAILRPSDVGESAVQRQATILRASRIHPMPYLVLMFSQPIYAVTPINSYQFTRSIEAYDEHVTSFVGRSLIANTYSSASLNEQSHSLSLVSCSQPLQ